MNNLTRLFSVLQALALVAVLAMATSWTTHAAIDVYQFDTKAQELEFQELTATLRCPKCQNNNIADSNAELAKDMRQKTFDMLKEGKSKQDVIDYMVARYGNFVTYNPPVMASTVILWVAPLFVIILGFTVLVMRSRKKSAAVQEPAHLEADEEARLKALLQEDASDASDTEVKK